MMSLQVISDENGKVLAAVRLAPMESAGAEGPSEIRLIPEPGDRLHDIQVPEESESMLESMGTLYVDLESGQPQLVQRSG
jgi:hypothetical protein